MKVLLISDVVLEHIYSNSIIERFKDIDFVISCGDLPNYYLEFIVSTLNKPLFYVMGNHNSTTFYRENLIDNSNYKERTIRNDQDTENLPQGCINLNQKIIEYKGLILMGLEGSMRYSSGEYQYTDFEMSWKINKLRPRLLLNKIFKKKYLDILVTHSPPYKIHDNEDLCHRGFRSFVKFINVYKPKYLIHGHIHLYGLNKEWQTTVGSTKVINAYGYRVIEI